MLCLHLTALLSFIYFIDIVNLFKIVIVRKIYHLKNILSNVIVIIMFGLHNPTCAYFIGYNVVWYLLQMPPHSLAMFHLLYGHCQPLQKIHRQTNRILAKLAEFCTVFATPLHIQE